MRGNGAESAGGRASLCRLEIHFPFFFLFLAWRNFPLGLFRSPGSPSHLLSSGRELHPSVLSLALPVCSQLLFSRFSLTLPPIPHLVSIAPSLSLYLSIYPSIHPSYYLAFYTLLYQPLVSRHDIRTLVRFYFIFILFISLWSRLGPLVNLSCILLVA